MIQCLKEFHPKKEFEIGIVICINASFCLSKVIAISLVYQASEEVAYFSVTVLGIYI